MGSHHTAPRSSTRRCPAAKMSARMYPLKVKFDFQEGDGPGKEEIESILNSKEGQEALERAFRSVTGKDDVVIHGSADAMARADEAKKGVMSPGPGQNFGESSALGSTQMGGSD